MKWALRYGFCVLSAIDSRHDLVINQGAAIEKLHSFQYHRCFIARCPNAEHIAAIRAAIDHGVGDPRLLKFLFEGPDIKRGTPWTKNLLRL
jgi:hypothetical protein